MLKLSFSLLYYKESWYSGENRPIAYSCPFVRRKTYSCWCKFVFYSFWSMKLLYWFRKSTSPNRRLGMGLCANRSIRFYYIITIHDILVRISRRPSRLFVPRNTDSCWCKLLFYLVTCPIDFQINWWFIKKTLINLEEFFFF